MSKPSASVSLHSVKPARPAPHDADGSSSDDEEDPEIAIDIHTEASKRSLAEAKEAAKIRKAAKPAQNKRPAPSSSSSSPAVPIASPVAGSDSSDDDEDDDDEFIHIPFELNDFLPTDFHIIKTLLHDYIPEESFALSEFSDLIAGQAAIGTAIKAEGTEEPLGFLTALNVGQYGQTKPIKQWREYLLKRCHDKSVADKFLKASEDAKTGLMVSHRVINVPQTIVPHLHDALIKDIEWAQANWERLGHGQAATQFDRFILVARCFQADFAAKLAPQSGHAKKKAKHGNSGAQGGQALKDGNLFFYRFEEEFYYKHADWSFRFAVAEKKKQTKKSGGEGEDGGDLPSTEADEKRREIPQTCIVMGFSMDAARKVRKALMDMLEEELA